MLKSLKLFVGVSCDVHWAGGREWLCVHRTTLPRTTWGILIQALTLTKHHIYSFPRPAVQTFANALHPSSGIYVRSLIICYHTSTPKKTPRALSIWVNDTCSQNNNNDNVITKRSNSASNWNWHALPHATCVRLPTSERFGYTQGAKKWLVIIFPSATFYLLSSPILTW